MNESRTPPEDVGQESPSGYRGAAPPVQGDVGVSGRRPPTVFSRLLVPLDGSRASERALGYARALAGAWGADVELLRVLRPGRAGGVSRDSVDWRLQRAEARAYLEERARELGAGGVEIRSHVVEGKPAEEIVGFVRERGVDLVVLSTHGQGRAEFSLGGVARKVVEGAGVSILIVRSREEDPADPVAPVELRRVVVPVDCSPLGDSAAALGATVARATGAELELVHVVPRPEMARSVAPLDDDRRLRRELLEVNRRTAQSYLEETRSRVEAPDLAVRIRLVQDENVPRALHGLDASDGRTLMVICAHGAGGTSPWPYGSVAQHMIAYGRDPLLVLQDQVRTGRPKAVREAARAGAV